jgi:ABC-2 type transport system permease protein
MSTAGLLRRESGYVRKVMIRNPSALFFTIGLPLLYLFVLVTVFGKGQVHLIGQPGTLKGSRMLVASVVTIGVVSASFQYLAMFLIRDREDGVLKRLRSAPVPTWVFLGGHLVNSVLTSVVLGMLVVALGWAVYGISVPSAHLPAVAVTVLVGALACCALGFAVTIPVRKLETATAVVPAIALTLFFLSGNFFNMDSAPAGLRAVASVFPIRHFYEAMLTAFNPHVTGGGFAPGQLGIVALWGAAGLVVAAWKFRWTPSAEG